MTGRLWAPLVGAIAMTAPVFVAVPAQAQEKTSYRDMYENLKSAVGLGQQREAIDYAPRPPLVVPPSYALPAPVDARTEQPSGFPVDPDVTARRKALMDPRRPTPFEDRTASGVTRQYLIDPPAAYLDANAVAATGKNADPSGGATAPKVHHRHHHKSDTTASAQ